MIEIKGLTQSYRHKQILRDVHLTVGRGEVCALVGRNGAGKTTLIHSILGLLPTPAGTVTLCGHPVGSQQWKDNVAYLPEKFQLYPQLTGEENLRFFAGLQSGRLNEQKLAECLRLVQLWEHRSEPIKGYSKGMLQRLGLGIMLYYDAEVLILDEPTSGLDPLGRTEILAILKSLRGKTILFSSHHIDEIRQICTHVAYLDDGVVTKYTIDEFCRTIAEGRSVR